MAACWSPASSCRKPLMRDTRGDSSFIQCKLRAVGRFLNPRVACCAAVLDFLQPSTLGSWVATLSCFVSAAVSFRGLSCWFGWYVLGFWRVFQLRQTGASLLGLRTCQDEIVELPRILSCWVSGFMYQIFGCSGLRLTVLVSVSWP